MKAIVTTGSSGGHIYPAIACLESLQTQCPAAEVVVVTSGRAVDKGFFSGIPGVRLVCAPEIRVSVIRVLCAFLATLRGCAQAIALYVRERPDVVVCFGSNISFPFGIVAWFFGIPLVVHEQNAQFGKANNCLRFFARRIALSFEGTSQSPRSVVTGNCIRRAVVAHAQQQHLYEPHTPLRVLVMGGSQGARPINEALIAMLEALPEDSHQQLQFVVIAGAAEYASVSERLRQYPHVVAVHAFVDDMAELYVWADVLVARAGGGVIAEAVAYQLPALYIPYPYAGGHQYDNAHAIRRTGGCVVLEQTMQLAHDMTVQLMQWSQDTSLLVDMSRKTQTVQRANAADELAALVLQEIGVKGES